MFNSYIYIDSISIQLLQLGYWNWSTCPSLDVASCEWGGGRGGGSWYSKGKFLSIILNNCEIILYIYQFESRTFRAKIPRASLWSPFSLPRLASLTLFRRCLPLERSHDIYLPYFFPSFSFTALRQNCLQLAVLWNITVVVCCESRCETEPYETLSPAELMGDASDLE